MTLRGRLHHIEKFGPKITDAAKAAEDRRSVEQFSALPVEVRIAIMNIAFHAKNVRRAGGRFAVPAPEDVLAWKARHDSERCETCHPTKPFRGHP
jgi:hypothetical protein